MLCAVEPTWGAKKRKANVAATMHWVFMAIMSTCCTLEQGDLLVSKEFSDSGDDWRLTLVLCHGWSRIETSLLSDTHPRWFPMSCVPLKTLEASLWCWALFLKCKCCVGRFLVCWSWEVSWCPVSDYLPFEGYFRQGSIWALWGEDRSYTDYCLWKATFI